MIATIMISSQYVTALQALTQSHRDLVRRDVIEMDLPDFEAEAEQNNSTFLDMRLSRDSYQCPNGYFR